MPESLAKKETLAQVFSVNFVERLRTSFFTQHLQWLLLSIEAENLEVLKTMKSNKQVFIGWFRG